MVKNISSLQNLFYALWFWHWFIPCPCERFGPHSDATRLPQHIPRWVPIFVDFLQLCLTCLTFSGLVISKILGLLHNTAICSRSFVHVWQPAMTCIENALDPLLSSVEAWSLVSNFSFGRQCRILSICIFLHFLLLTLVCLHCCSWSCRIWSFITHFW